MSVIIYIVIISAALLVLTGILWWKRKEVSKNIVSIQEMYEYYDNGNTRRKYLYKTVTSSIDGTIINEGIDGIEQFFYPSGKLNRENNWKNDQLNGPFIVYYEDGKVYIKGTYKYNKLSGVYSVFDKGNKVIWTKKY